MKQQETRRRYSYNCSFCGRSQDQAKSLIAGPGASYICDACIDLIQRGDGTQLEDMSFFYAASKASENKEVACAFCGKRPPIVSYLVGSSRSGGRLICDECVDLCRERIVEEQRSITSRPDSTSEGSQASEDS